MHNYIRNIYIKFRAKLPLSFRVLLTQIVFKFSDKPFSTSSPLPKYFDGGEILAYPEGYLSALCISADFEMSWAWRYARVTPSEDMGLKERNNISPLLELFDKYNIPITWATVGHLFLESCECDIDNKPHPELPRLAYFENKNWCYDKGDWFDDDPCSNLQEAPGWYASDLIKLILNSNTNHEIACHTFSHITCDDIHCPPEVLDAELKACKKVMAEYNLIPYSLVFPGGTNGNYATLFANGIRVIRGRLGLTELAYPIQTKEGLWLINTSACIEPDAIGSSIEAYLNRLKCYLKKAIKTNLVAHLWFHPSMKEDVRDILFPALLEYANTLRNEKKLWIATMKEIASYCELRNNLQIELISKNKYKIIYKEELSSFYESSSISLLFKGIEKVNKIEYAGEVIENNCNITKKGLILTLSIMTGENILIIE